MRRPWLPMMLTALLLAGCSSTNATDTSNEAANVASQRSNDTTEAPTETDAGRTEQGTDETCSEADIRHCNPEATGHRACELDDDGGLRWGALTACGEGETCQDGACVPTNDDGCEDPSFTGPDCDECADSAFTGPDCDTPNPCDGAPNGTVCDDDNPCTVADYCQSGACQPGPNQCACQTDADCLENEDGNFCNGTLICDLSGSEPVCTVDPNTKIVCPDTASPCVLSECDPPSGFCEEGPAPDGTICLDDNACNGLETCLNGVCEAGDPLQCDDGDACNGIESCQSGVGCVENTPPVCDDGDPCNGVEYCDSQTGCEDGAPTNCDDGNVCNGEESCDEEEGCQAGEPLECDDGNPCNGVDYCDEDDGCLTAAAPDCDDGNPCNGVEGCAPNTGCVDGVPPTCDDGDPTTTNGCDEEVGCVYTDQGPDIVATAQRWVRIRTEVTNAEANASWVAWSEIEVIGRWTDTDEELSNLALGASATASSSYEQDDPSLAIDGDEGTGWNAGDFPPAEILIDLGAWADIASVRLLVKQQPAGTTKHVLEMAGSALNYQSLHVFSGHTKNGDWLEWPGEDDSGEDGTGGTDTSGLPRGIAWVRNNPMFISGLSVSTGSPSVSEASAYHDGWHATAVHMWKDGLKGPLDGWMDAGGEDTRWVVWVHDDGKTTGPDGEVIGGKGANPPGRIGYQIGDEPGLDGDGMEELKAIEVGVDAVRVADPDSLIIVNFSFWAEEIEEMLDYYGSEMDADIFCYDRYAMDYKEHETLALIRDAALKWDRPYWRYMRSYQDVGVDAGFTEKDFRWHAFIGLLYGYTGHTWFVYQANAPHKVQSDLFADQGGFDVATEPEWAWTAQINVEMRHLGKVITQLTSTDVRYVFGQFIYEFDGLVEWEVGSGGDPYITAIETQEGGIIDYRDLAIGFFEDDDGELYTMIQNQNHPNAHWVIAGDETSTVEVDFDFSGAPSNLDKDHLLILNHLNGAQEEVSLENMGGNARRFTHALPSGEPVLFKYATGTSFPQGP